LKTGDQVRIQKTGGGILNDNDRHYTHYSVWLAEEEDLVLD